MVIRLIVFDLDGVLVDSGDFYKEIICRAIFNSGFKFTKKEIINALGARLSNALDNLGIRDKKKRAGISREVFSSAGKGITRLKLCDYAKESLKETKKRGLKTALITNSERRYAESFVKKHKLAGYFEDVLGGDEFSDKKEAFKMLYAKYKAKPSETLYLGDRVSDLETAKAAGCRAALVYSCSWEKEHLRKDKYKKHLIKDLSEFPSLIS